MVLIQVPDFLKERVTKGGIIIDVNPKTQYMDSEGSHMADLERVVGIVEKVPPGLTPDGDMLAWTTEMELKVGATVYFDYYDSINSTSFVCGEDEYRLIPYSACYLAVRNVEPFGNDAYWEESVCLNGYCLFEDVYEEVKFSAPGETKKWNLTDLDEEGRIKGAQSDVVFQPHPKLEKLKGKVFAIAAPVDYCGDYSDDVDIEPGDIVEFRDKFSRIYLERQDHLRTLDKKLFRAQRREIIFNHKQ